MTGRRRYLLGLVAAALLACPPVAFAQAASSVTSPPAVDPGLLAAAAQQEPAPPPLPRRSGARTLLRETLNDFKAFPARRSTWIILGVGGALALAAHPVDGRLNPHLVGHTWAERLWKPGHVIGSTPVMIGVPVGIYLAGRYLVPAAQDEPRTNKWSHLGLDLIRAGIVELAIVEGVKLGVRRTRPNGGHYSFPSGHAGATFALATVLERHLGYRLSWPTLAIATYVATSRLHDNVHYLSDVLFGAAVGTAAGWTVVGRHGRSNYALVPLPVRGGFALSVTRTPRS